MNKNSIIIYPMNRFLIKKQLVFEIEIFLKNEIVLLALSLI